MDWFSVAVGMNGVFFLTVYLYYSRQERKRWKIIRELSERVDKVLWDPKAWAQQEELKRQHEVEEFERKYAKKLELLRADPNRPIGGAERVGPAPEGEK